MGAIQGCSLDSRSSVKKGLVLVRRREILVFLKSLKLDGLLSFPPGAEAIPLTPLNVLIGPNASGKSNLLEAVELLHATPTAFAAAIRDGGGVQEWLWKGKEANGHATIEAL